MLCYSRASAASSHILLLGDSTLTPGSFSLLQCVRQLKSILTLIFQGVGFSSCYRNAFPSARGRLYAAGDAFRALRSSILNCDLQLAFWGYFFSPDKIMWLYFIPSSFSQWSAGQVVVITCRLLHSFSSKCAILLPARCASTHILGLFSSAKTES